MTVLQTKIVELNRQSPAPFSNTIVRNYANLLRERNINLNSKSISFVGSVPIEKVIGIDQSYGDDSSWGEWLEGSCLKRLKYRMTELQESPEYYLSDELKDGMSFAKIGEEYFVVTGKHRTTIAKFLAHFNPMAFSNRSPLSSVQITEYFVDYEYQDIEKRFESLELRYPGLKFELEHTSTDVDRRFLLIREKCSHGLFEAYTRQEAIALLNDFESPSLIKKLKPAKSIYDRDVYRFISYGHCLKNIFV